MGKAFRLSCAMSNDHLVARASPLGVGDPASDFTLTDQGRVAWRLADHLAKGDVVLCFVPFAFTGVCSTEMRCVSDQVARWRATGATVVGVDCDSPFANKAWSEKEGYSHTILSDSHRAVCRAYGLYWSEMNVAQRGTVVIGGAGGPTPGRVKMIDARPPGQAMDFERVLGAV